MILIDFKDFDFLKLGFCVGDRFLILWMTLVLVHGKEVAVNVPSSFFHFYLNILWFGVFKVELIWILNTFWFYVSGLNLYGSISNSLSIYRKEVFQHITHTQSTLNTKSDHNQSTKPYQWSKKLTEHSKHCKQSNIT